MSFVSLKKEILGQLGISEKKWWLMDSVLSMGI
jgi:hypothetical protein